MATDKTLVKPIIYQLIPRLFANYCPNPVVNGTLEQNGSGKLNDITKTVLNSIKKLGVTHVWYTGVIEHAHDADYTAYGIERHNHHFIKGHAGSPYAITDYYDIDPDLAVDVNHRLDEFDKLVERTHQVGLKVIIDFVPNHVARQYHSDVKPAGVEDLGENDNQGMFFSPTNNFFYLTGQQFAPHVDMGQGSDAYVEFPAKASGNDCFTASPGEFDWYDTVKLNYGVDPANGSKHFDPIPPTWHKMLHILKYWAGRGVDGFRCDMVHMVPVEFWHWAIADIKTTYPDIKFIAEIYDLGLYRPYIYDGGFDYLYDKVNLYDTLRDIECNNSSAARLTSCWQTVEGVSDNMLNFLENHDEQRFASKQYAGDPWRVLPSLVVSATMSKGPMMIYAGQELGEPAADAEGYSGLDGRTTIFDYWSIKSIRNWLNGGKCDGKLSEDIEKLRNTYAKVLTICNKERAISEGGFFDLMYVNYDNPGFDANRQYAYLRHIDGETLLIVVNFSDQKRQIAVNIPQHAFVILNVEESVYSASELLSGKRTTVELASTHPFVTDIEAHGAVIWKLTQKKVASKTKKAEKNSTKISKKR
jgi:glycosidase